MRPPDDPYEPPEASLTGPIRVRSHWFPVRWIPTVLLGGFGVLFLVGSMVIALETARAHLGSNRLTASAGPSLRHSISVVVVLGLLGVLALTAARSWHVCRWTRAVVLTLVTYALGVAYFTNFTRP